MLRLAAATRAVHLNLNILIKISAHLHRSSQKAQSRHPPAGMAQLHMFSVFVQHVDGRIALLAYTL
jgi:hypothetical protein